MIDETRIRQLVVKLQQNDRTYFDAFYNETKKYVFYMCYSIVRSYDDAEDLLQDTYIKFLQHIQRVNLNKSIMAYLMTIARNTSLNYIKKKSKEVIVEWDNVEDTKTVVEDYEKLELVDKMKKILKPIEFEVVILHVINDLTHKEISQILKKPLGTITYTYKCAIDKLRREINEY